MKRNVSLTAQLTWEIFAFWAVASALMSFLWSTVQMQPWAVGLIAHYVVGSLFIEFYLLRTSK